MERKYRLLVTRRALDALLTTSQSDQDRVVSFLNLLVSGGWEEESDQFDHILTWKPSEKERFIFSCSLSNHSFAVWEVLWTTDLAARLDVTEYGEREAPHHILPHVVLYSIDVFPGKPDTVIRILNEDFQVVGPVDPSHLDIDDRERRDEVRYNEELFVLVPDRIPDVVKGSQEGLPLHLTTEQADVLGTHRVVRGPILMSGEAGSGKTSVITHWLLINRLEGISSQLFVTFSPRLVERTKTEFEQTVPPSYRQHGVRFSTYRDLLWEIADLGGLGLRDPDKEMTFERFLREYSYRVPKYVDPVLLWDEIRSVIKGGSLDINKRMIDVSTYEYLSDKRGQSKTPKGIRDSYYEQAQLYQNYLDKNGLWDSVDLAFDCLGCIERVGSYDRIACDEVQDLAPVEIRVLIELVKECSIDNIFLTGDMAQVINPSGFSWDRLKGFLGDFSRRHDIRDAWSLDQNFRSSREIIELVNEMIRVRESVLNDASGRNIQDSDVTIGLKPIILREDPMERLRQAISSPRQRLVLVKTREQKELVKKALGDMSNKVTILTVEESKGLEWDGVLLWNFFVPRHEVITKNDWMDIFIPKKRRRLAELIEQGEKNAYGLAYEFNLLHVGLTRARKVLCIYDENEDLTISALSDAVSSITDEISLEAFLEKWETSLPSPEELEFLAMDLMEKDMDQAFIFFELAAEEYEKKGRFENAAACYFAISEFKLAATCYEKAENECLQEKMLALNSREGGDQAKAGLHWERHSEIALELGEWRTAYDGFGSAATAHITAADEEGSASQRKKHYEHAARMYEQRSASISQQTKTSYLAARAEAMYEAGECWEEAESIENAQRCREGAIAMGRDIVQSGVAASIGGDIPEAWMASCFTRMADCEKTQGNLVKAADLALKAGQSYSEAEKKAELVAERENHLDSQNMWVQRAVEWYKAGGERDVAIDTQRKLRKQWEEKRDQPRRMDIWEGLVDLLRDSGKTDEYVSETIGLVRLLRENREKDRAYKLLESQVKWCEVNETPECLLKMLNVLGESYKDDKEHNLAGRTLDRIGDIHVMMGAGREAISSYVEAGRSFHRHSSRVTALESFEKALGVAGAEMTPDAIGWTCFKDIAVDSLVPAGHENLAWMWIETAIDHFAGEYDLSVQRIKSYSQTLEEKLERVNSELEEEKDKDRIAVLEDWKSEILTGIGWTLHCQGRLYQKGLEEKIAPVGHRQAMMDAYSGSIDAFRRARNEPMASKVEKETKHAREP